MTSTGARYTIDAMAMRIFEIEDIQAKLQAEKQALRERIEELEWVTDEFFQDDPESR